jgi:tellurite resistance protein TehA-like permease
MWLNIKIGMFYAAPVFALLLALVACVVLLQRVRSGRLSPRRAALRSLWTLFLPVSAVLLVWLTGEVAGYFSAPRERYVWDADISLNLLRGLLPIGTYVAAAIGGLLLLLWILLWLRRDKS